MVPPEDTTQLFATTRDDPVVVEKRFADAGLGKGQRLLLVPIADRAALGVHGDAGRGHRSRERGEQHEHDGRQSETRFAGDCRPSSLYVTVAGHIPPFIGRTHELLNDSVGLRSCVQA